MSGVEGSGVLGAQKPQVEEEELVSLSFGGPHSSPGPGEVGFLPPHLSLIRAGSEQAGQTPKIQEVSCTSKMISCSFGGNRWCLRGDFTVHHDRQQHSEGISKRKDKVTPFRWSQQNKRPQTRSET